MYWSKSFSPCTSYRNTHVLQYNSADHTQLPLHLTSRSTFGALPFVSASSQRDAHKHQRSPAFSPGNLPGMGVERSLPFALVNFRKSSVTTAATAWTPKSPSVTRQNPSRLKPQPSAHGPSCPPSTFLCAVIWAFARQIGLCGSERHLEKSEGAAIRFDGRAVTLNSICGRNESICVLSRWRR